MLKRLRNFLLTKWPFLLILILILIFFYPIWLNNQIPIPGDFVVGTYRPWLDYKWGYTVGVPVKNPLLSDVVSVIYPIKNHAIEMIKNFEVPLWIDNMFAGYPLLANMQLGLLAPTMILYFLFDKLTAWSLQVVAQPLLAVSFTYLLLRYLKRSKLASVVGGLIYAFGAFCLTYLEWNAHTLVAAWIPLLVMCVLKIINRDKVLQWGIALSVVLCFQILSGYPQLVVISSIFLLFVTLFNYKKLNIKTIFIISGFYLLGIILSSIQLFPSIELYLNSQRVTEFLDKDLRYFPVLGLLTLVVPDFFGNPASGNFFGSGYYTSSNIFSGVVATALAFYAVCKKSKESIVLCCIFGIVFFLLFIIKNPLNTYLYENSIVGFSALSLTRATVIINLCVAILAAFGLDRITQEKNRIEFYPLMIIASMVTLGVTFSIFKSKYFPDESINPVHLPITIRNIIFPLITMVGLTVGIFIIRLGKKNIGLLVILIILVSELFRFGWKFTTFVDKSLLFPSTPIIEYLKDEATKDVFRIDTVDVIPMDMWVPYDLESPSGYDAVFPGRWSKFINVVKQNDVETRSGSRYEDFNLVNSRIYDLVNVKYAIFQKRDIKDNPTANGQIRESYRQNKMEKVFDDQTVSVYRNNKSFDRAKMFYKWEIADDDKTLENLINPKVDTYSKLMIGSDPDIKQELVGDYSIEWIRRNDTHKMLIVNTEKDGMLFVSDMYYPGWTAYVDGEKREIVKADYTFRSLPIKKGIHKVEFIYSPQSFKIGKLVSLVTLILLSLLFIYGQITKRSN